MDARAVSAINRWGGKDTVIAHFQQVSHTSAKFAGVVISLNSGTGGKGVDKLPLKLPAGIVSENSEAILECKS